MSIQHGLEAQCVDVNARRWCRDGHPGDLRPSHLRHRHRAANETWRHKGVRTAWCTALLFRLDRQCRRRRGGVCRQEGGAGTGYRGGASQRPSNYYHHLALGWFDLYLRCHRNSTGRRCSAAGRLSDSTVKSVGFQDEFQLIFLTLESFDVILEFCLL